MSKTPKEIAQYIEEMTKEYEKYIKPKKKIPPQELINNYIEKAGRDPKAIKEMIEAKREASIKVVSDAKNLYATRNAELDTLFSKIKDGTTKKQIADAQTKRALIEKIKGNITELRATELNLSNKKDISSQFDKQLDTAQRKKIIKIPAQANNVNASSTQQNSDGPSVQQDSDGPSVKALKAELKQTEKALKTWQELAKARDDTDRSKGFAKLSDNLASMATTSVNATRKALAFGQALLTYAVVDVLYEGLVKGTGEGLIKGADTGYKAANDRVKSVANNIHKMIVNPQKKLNKEVDKLMGSYSEEINANITVLKNVNQERIASLNNKLVGNSKFSPPKEYVSVKDYLDSLALREKATMLTAFLNETNNQQAAQSLQKSFDPAYYSKEPSLPTRVVAGAAGVVPAIVVGAVNAVWEGIKKPTLAATVDMPEGVGNRLTNLKQDKEWARTHSEVKQHREAKKMAEALGKYAKKANSEQFTQMEKDLKAKKQEEKKQFRTLKKEGLFL